MLNLISNLVFSILELNESLLNAYDLFIFDIGMYIYDNIIIEIDSYILTNEIQLLIYYYNKVIQFVIAIITNFNKICINSINTTSLLIFILINLVLINLNRSTNFNYLKSILWLFLTIYLILLNNKLEMWSLFIVITELTSVYLIITILSNYTLKTKKQLTFFLLPLIFIIPLQMVTSYEYFNFFRINVYLLKFNTLNALIIFNSFNIYLLLLLILLLTFLLLLYLLTKVISNSNRNVLDYVYNIKTLINKTSTNLNNFIKDLINKWN